MSPRFDWPVTPGASTQTYEIALPLLSLGVNEFVVTWSLPWANATYTVAPAVEGGVAILGKAEATIKAGTRTATQVTIVVNNSGLVTIAAGASLHVIGAGQLL